MKKQRFQPSWFHMLPSALLICIRFSWFILKTRKTIAYLTYFFVMWVWNLMYYTFLSYNVSTSLSIEHHYSVKNAANAAWDKLNLPNFLVEHTPDPLWRLTPKVLVWVPSVLKILPIFLEKGLESLEKQLQGNIQPSWVKRLVNKELTIFPANFFLWNQCGKFPPQDRPFLPTWRANQNSRFALSCPFADSALQ